MAGHTSNEESGGQHYGLLSAASIACAFGIWFVVSNFIVVNSLSLPTPQVLLAAFVDLVRDGYGQRSLGEHILTSMERALTGFILAVLFSSVIGLAAGYNSAVRAIIMPFIDFLRPIPALAFVPLFVFFFGIGEFSKIGLIFIGAFVYMALQTSDGVRSIPEELFRVGEGLGFSTWQMFQHIIVRGALPSIVTGMRTALSLSWSLVVAAELIAAPSGLGYIIMDGTQFFRIHDVYCVVILLGVIGYGMDRVIVALGNRIIHWQGK
jgi:ABC-type nitrate/sulfonate/bicarbonate transport system permease component